MKITDRGFSVTDLNIPGIKGIDVTDESIAIVAEPGQISHMFGMREWREFSAAVAAVNERLKDISPSDTRATVIDGEGDEWTPIPNTDLYRHDGMEHTRQWIRGTWGIREG